MLLPSLLVLMAIGAPDESPTPLAIAWHHHAPLVADPSTGQLRTPRARELVTRTAYVASALLREHPDIQASVCISSSLLFQIDRVYLRHLLPFLDRARNRMDGAAFLARYRGRTDPWIDQALAPSLRFDEDTELAESTLRFFPQFDSLRAKRREERSREDVIALSCWRLLGALSPLFFETRMQLANGSIIDLSDLVRRGPGGTYLATRAFTEDDANRLVAEVVRILESFVLVHRAQRRAPDAKSGPKGNIELLTTPFPDPPLAMVEDRKPYVRAGKTLFESAIGWPPSGIVATPRWSSFELRETDRTPGDSVRRLLGATFKPKERRGPGEARGLIALETSRIAAGSTRDLHGLGFVRHLYRELDRRRRAGGLRFVDAGSFHATPTPKELVSSESLGRWKRVTMSELSSDALTDFALKPETVSTTTRARVLTRARVWFHKSESGESEKWMKTWFEMLIGRARG